MATVNLLPNADISNSPAWTLSTGSDIWALLDEDFAGAGVADGSMISATASGKKCVVGFQDFTEDHSSITSVQAILRTVNPGRGSNYTIGMSITNNGSGAASWAEQTIAETGSRFYDTLTFTARTTSSAPPSGAAWDEDDFGTDALAMEIHLDAIDSSSTRVTYAYFIVTYVAAVSADNATFFGTNF